MKKCLLFVLLVACVMIVGDILFAVDMEAQKMEHASELQTVIRQIEIRRQEIDAKQQEISNLILLRERIKGAIAACDKAIQTEIAEKEAIESKPRITTDEFKDPPGADIPKVLDIYQEELKGVPNTEDTKG